MKKHHVYGIGNALVDIEIEVSHDFLRQNNIEKGMMSLVDLERQSELLKLAPEQHRRTCGGSAANTIIAVRQLGGRSFYSCKVAADEMGDFYFSDLVGHGVETNLRGDRPEGVSGRCLIFITPDGDRTMNTYLGITSDLGTGQLELDELADSQMCYIEGYLVTSPSAMEAAAVALEVSAKHGVHQSLTFSDPGIVKFFRPQFLELIKKARGGKFDLIFCNEAEALSFTQTESLDEAAKAMKDYARSFAITRGPMGAYTFDGNKEVYILPPKVEVVDTNGAGDLFAGGFLYAITHGRNFAEAGQLSCALSSQLVTQFGARLRGEQTQAIAKNFI